MRGQARASGPGTSGRVRVGARVRALAPGGAQKAGA